MFTQRCLPILEDEIPVPVLVRNRGDELLVEEEYGRRVVTASVFATEIKNTTAGLLNNERKHDDDEDYCGLDSDRDTEEEIETIVRLYLAGSLAFLKPIICCL